MKRTWMWVGCVLVLMVLGVVQTRATDYYVAQDEQTPDPAGQYTNWVVAASNIQDAVEVALHGDTIWIGPGRYKASDTPPVALFNTNVVFADNKGLNFRGASGDPADVIINGEGKYRAFAASRTSGGTLGFTFDSLTISNCLSTNYSGGSAIFFNTSDRSSTSMVLNCVITDCSALRGGGIHWQAKNSNPNPGLIVSNSVFRSNQSSESAGAIWTYYNFNLRLIDCVFENNQAERTTVSTRYANTLIDRCVFTGNVNDYGVIGLGECRATVRNSLFSGNTATENGVLYASNPGLLDVQNCTIVNNAAGSSSFGAIYLYTSLGGLTGTVVNCVMYSNTVWNVKIRGDNPFYATFYVTNTCSSHTNYIPNFYVDGNITNDPKFVNFDAGDFRLANGSLCIDAGTNLPWTADAIDLDGNPRRDATFGQVDMGAYEYLYHGTTIMVQ